MSYNELKTHGREDFPFEIYRVNNRHPDYTMNYHWHTDIEIIRVTRGTLHLTVDDNTYTLHSGDIVFINSEALHSAVPKYCSYECLCFNLAFLKNGNHVCDEFIDKLLSHQIFLAEQPADTEIIEHCHQIFKDFIPEKPGFVFKIVGRIQMLLGFLQEKQCYTSLPSSLMHDTKKFKALKAALELIQENYAEEITLADMASVAGLSQQYFCKFFKDMTQLTPVQYLMQYRIEQATKKLIASNLSITQIATLCGFNNVSYFIKTFKSMRGIPPAEYRKK